MPPDRGRAGPQRTGPALRNPHRADGHDGHSTSTSTIPGHGDTHLQLRELLTRILASDRPSYESGWADGYRLGFDAGWDVGYGRARVELDERWRALAERVVRVATGRSAAELRRLRDMPTGEAWQRWRERYGEYRGGRVPWQRRGTDQ